MNLENAAFGRARRLHLEMACIKTEMNAVQDELAATTERVRRGDLTLRLD